MLAGPLSDRRVRRAAAAADVGSPDRRARRSQGRAPAQRGRRAARFRIAGSTACTSAPAGREVGELDEEMVAESRKGETFILGATTWRIEDITRDRVIVSPGARRARQDAVLARRRPGPAGRARPRARRVLPRARRPARARRRGRARVARGRLPPRRVRRRQPDRATSAISARRPARCRPIARSRSSGSATSSATSACASCRRSAAASTRRGRSCSRTSSRTELGYPIHPLWTDDGIALRFADGDVLPDDDQLIPDPDDVERVLVDELARSSVFASHFRENAARALLLPRRRPGQRTPLWAQRLRAQQLMGVALRFPAFPITLETYREVLRDVFDLPALLDVLRQIRSRAIRDRAGDRPRRRRRSRARWCSITSPRSSTKATRRSPSARRRR